MGTRKRSRPNPKVEPPPEALQNAAAGQAQVAAPPLNVGVHIDHTSGGEDRAPSVSEPILQESSSIKSHSSRAWYAGGSWPRVQKGSPSTQVARETILADKPKNTLKSVDFSRFDPRKTDATLASTNSPLSISQGEVREDQELKPADNSAISREVVINETGNERRSAVASDNSNPSNVSPVEAQRPVVASGWRDWLGLSIADQRPQPELVKSQVISGGSKPSKPQSLQTPFADPSIHEQVTSSKSEEDDAIIAPVQSSPWFRIWPGSASSKNMTDDIDPNEHIPAGTPMPEVPAVEVPSGPESKKRPLPGSTWAFWSKDVQRPALKGGEPEETGELAVAGESSQDNPAPAHPPILEESKGVEPSKTNKRVRQPQFDVQETASKVSVVDSSIKKPTTENVSVASRESSNKATSSPSPVASKPLPANTILPSFKSTYRLAESPSIIQQIARLLMHSNQKPANHVLLVKDPPKIRKALAIGIHGLFPAPLLRTVIGQPTGTSIRFANHAAAAIHKWAIAHGHDCEVEKVALEGEGKIGERVDNLWKLLLNWIDHVRASDLIIIACHSQGVPVAVMIAAKLIEFGVVTGTRIGICAMAGVSLGPFTDYKSRLFSGSAAELFEFANQSSEVSKRYENSLRVTLQYGVRITFIGSIDDQLVSLESALFMPINHPYIYRSVFVDGRVHAPDFIAHLVGFALKLRNLGVSDHGLIRELSLPLAGSLYTGDGHSRLYDEAKVYYDAVSFTLETTSVGAVPLQIQKVETPTSTNPFQLPWSIRGLLEENIVKTELDQETMELLRQFDQWKPTTKVLKDVKYRLEAVKSKL